MIKLSKQQAKIIKNVTEARENLLIQARAGCGKTFMLLEIVKAIIPTQKNIFLGAYNKAIADELGEKLKVMGAKFPQVVSSTMHSAGFSCWKKVAPKVKVEEKKTSLILAEIEKELQAALLKHSNKYDEIAVKVNLCYTAFNLVCKAISLAKQSAFGFLNSYEDKEKWFDLINYHGLDEDLEDDSDIEIVINLCIAVYRKSIAKNYEMIDYDDMIFAPLYHKTRTFQYDWVLIDEGQDTNAARRALAAKMLKLYGRIVIVGDDCQAVYGFTGADNDSLDILKNTFNCKVLPLTVTRRCAKKIVEVAQKWVPDFEAFEDNAEGVVRSIPFLPTKENEPSLQDEIFQDEDAILCRNNKPLVELAYTLLRKGIACKVEGREIGNGLISLVKRWKVTTFNGLRTRLNTWKDREIQKAKAKGNEMVAASIEDKHETLICLIEKLQGDGKTKVIDLIEFIQTLFGDTKNNKHLLTLSSIHKSKGREWNKVYILGMNKFQPSKWANKNWQRQQEQNLMYVAVTRAKYELVQVVM
jgi:DNA helicase II / ATP-dependent DNA helicase PcrA